MATQPHHGMGVMGQGVDPSASAFHSAPPWDSLLRRPSHADERWAV